MQPSPAARPTPAPPRSVLVRGLAPRFALIIVDPRLAAALRVACVEDAIDVHFPESRIHCRLRRPPTGRGLLCAFGVTHLSLDGGAEEHHHWDTVLGDGDGPAQREAVLRHLHAFRCAAKASRVRVATRILRPEGVARRPTARELLTAGWTP
ncbi:hypothetical protein [Streptomyces sp. NPDC048225]|uniref:hypothetical protein n=1 Tax=Streptomyces sp. NPDC048225 TaxID=3365518 RepID=UPI003712DABC